MQRRLKYDSTDLRNLVCWEYEVSPAALLAHLLKLEGVVDAALIDRAGEPLAPLSETQPLASAQEALATCLTSDRVLAELLGAETPSQTVLEFASETVLLSLSAELTGEPCRVVALCKAADLSRVRFGLRRLLPQAAFQAPTPDVSDAYAS